MDLRASSAKRSCKSGRGSRVTRLILLAILAVKAAMRIKSRLLLRDGEYSNNLLT